MHLVEVRAQLSFADDCITWPRLLLGVSRVVRTCQPCAKSVNFVLPLVWGKLQSSFWVTNQFPSTQQYGKRGYPRWTIYSLSHVHSRWVHTMNCQNSILRCTWFLAFAQSSVPVVSPTVTPVPPERVDNQTFTLMDVSNNSLLCLRMTVAIVINITYINSKGVSCFMGELLSVAFQCCYYLCRQMWANP